jgi:uncharacterized protein with HEPN domain
LRNVRLRLVDMLAAAEAANEYMAAMSTTADLGSDRKSRHAVLHNLFVLGEAAKGVPDSMRTQYPEIPWRSVAGLRDILAHEYFGIDDEIVWDVVKNKLPTLIEQLRGILPKIAD